MSEKFKYDQYNQKILKNNLFNPENSDEEFDNRENINDNKVTFLKREDSKIDRVRKLTEKLSKLQTNEQENPNKFNKIETKLESVEENFIYSYETLKSKYSTLKDHTVKMKKILEDESGNKDDLRRNLTDKIKNMQNRVKSMIIEEREHFKDYTENVCNKLEAELIRCETELKRDDDLIMKNINEIKENIKNDLPEISNKIKNEKADTEKTMDLLFEDMNLEFNKLNNMVQEIVIRRDQNNKNVENAIGSVVNSVNENIYFENEKMRMFKDNIFKLLDETTNQIANKK